jgi:ribonuclease P/MRP protein subunit POP1
MHGMRFPFLQLTSNVRFSAGSRALETHIYKVGSYPFDLIAPISIIWKPVAYLSSSTEDGSAGKAQPSKDSGSASQKNTEKRRKKRKGKEKEKAQPASEGTRLVWLRSHPSVFDGVFSSLRAAASLALDIAKRSMGEEEKDIDVEIADLRGQINVFEIMGPKSSQVLKGALPVPQDQKEEFTQVVRSLFSFHRINTHMQFQFWGALSDLQTPGSIPRGMIIGFKVLDPRLKYALSLHPSCCHSSVLRFPPKNAKPRPSDSDHVKATVTTFPSASLARSEIWDEATRKALLKPRYKKKDLDERRSKVSANRSM